MRSFICDNCEIDTSEEDIIPIDQVKDLLSRVAPGEVMPYGECPECGVFVHEFNLAPYRVSLHVTASAEKLYEDDPQADEEYQFMAEEEEHALEQFHNAVPIKFLENYVIEANRINSYTIPCSWQVYGTIEIPAVDLEEAIAIAESDETPLPEGTYVDASFEIDHDILENDYPD